MILYNITVNVQKDVEQKWVDWMKDTHIPEVMDTGFFKEFRFYRLLMEDDSGGTNFSIQFFAENMDELEQYLEDHAPRLRDDHQKQFKDQQVSFRSLLEEVI